MSKNKVVSDYRRMSARIGRSHTPVLPNGTVTVAATAVASNSVTDSPDTSPPLSDQEQTPGSADNGHPAPTVSAPTTDPAPGEEASIAFLK